MAEPMTEARLAEIEASPEKAAARCWYVDPILWNELIVEVRRLRQELAATKRQQDALEDLADPFGVRLFHGS